MKKTTSVLRQIQKDRKVAEAGARWTYEWSMASNPLRTIARVYEPSASDLSASGSNRQPQFVEVKSKLPSIPVTSKAIRLEPARRSDVTSISTSMLRKFAVL